MAERREFAKLHGLGNDFVLLDLRRPGSGVAPSAVEALALCDRHTGVGADGVLTLLPAGGADARLVIHNADGSVPEMCGNGARCAALWLATEGCEQPGRRTVTLLTDAGPRPCAVRAEVPELGEVEIEMGEPEFGPVRPLLVGGADAAAQPVSMGNPHRVIWIDGTSDRLRALAERDGPSLCLAENANIEFAARRGLGRFEAVVFERGAGLTLACGTGACAVAAAAVARGDARRGEEVAVQLPGGPLFVTWTEAGQVRMRGPAQLVYRGRLPS